MNNLVASSTSALIVPRWLHATLFLLFLSLIGLFLSRPNAAQFSQQVWTSTLDGIKADLTDRRERSTLYSLLKIRFSPMLNVLESGKEAELNRLPGFWMEHTTVEDWKILTLFRYTEAACSSHYLGIAGRIINLGDGCNVEPYRKKGGNH